MAFTLEDVVFAYRKAKVDFYYTSHGALGSILNYENDLHGNLCKLLERVNGVDEAWVKDPEFLGGWTVATKRMGRGEGAAASNGGVIFSSPESEWAYICSEQGKMNPCARPCGEFRVMAKLSVDFHVLSALWMLTVGDKYDKQLGSCAYGNRLRRTRSGEINKLSLGSFKPYLNPFRRWRDNGLNAMRTALVEQKKVVAVTADIDSFYHKLNPAFMLDERFNAHFHMQLSAEEWRLHKLFITALSEWAGRTPLERGLPVGLPASAVVANAALVELDKLVTEQIAPIYYGRYVDDVILVMENGANFRSHTEIWEWIFARSGERLAWRDSESKSIVKFSTDYLEASRIEFSNGKNKMFLLEGATGQTMLASIDRHIRRGASEWRALPNLPRSPDSVSADLVAATQSDGEAADNLRKADILSMRRAAFAIKLRDFEAYERDLEPEAWSAHRHAFFDAIVRHVLVLPHFFDLEPYLPKSYKARYRVRRFSEVA